MSDYTKGILKIVVAQLCQGVGWKKIKPSCLHILTDIFQRHLRNMAILTHEYALLRGVDEPNLNDVFAMTEHLGIKFSDLEKYMNTTNTGLILHVPKYPVPNESHLNFLNPDSDEIKIRPKHIYKYLPTMMIGNAEENNKNMNRIRVRKIEELRGITNTNSSQVLENTEVTVHKIDDQHKFRRINLPLNENVENIPPTDNSQKDVDNTQQQETSEITVNDIIPLGGVGATSCTLENSVRYSTDENLKFIIKDQKYIVPADDFKRKKRTYATAFKNSEDICEKKLKVDKDGCKTSDDSSTTPDVESKEK